MQARSASLPEVDASLAAQLQRGCTALASTATYPQQELLLAYLDLLCKWNKTYNLTAVRDAAQMVTRHLLDSLAVAPYLRGQRAIDVGTGAGLPGVVLAITHPEQEFHLLDSNGKKARFLFQVKTALRLDNMVVHQARVESFHCTEPFDVVLSRAFASLGDMLQACRPLVSGSGCFLAMKGAYPTAELEAIEAQGWRAVVHPLAVPGLDEQRHLVEISSTQVASHSN